MRGFRLFDASQRGDIYHIRAWQVLQRVLMEEHLLDRSEDYALSLPTVVFNATNDCADTAAYVTELFPPGVPLFVCAWTWKELIETARGSTT